jgi:ferric-dicitrate binding protein FerR (iron transport regulator)
VNHTLLEKYFNDECTAEELEKVLCWFQTEEGKAFLKKDIDQQKEQLAKQKKTAGDSPVASQKIYNRILRHRQVERFRQPRRWRWASVASIIIMAAVISVLFYWGDLISPKTAEPGTSSSYFTYSTAAGQQQVLTLPDGTKIRMDENTTLLVSRHSQDSSIVTLKGEAYFQVTHDPDHPFIVKANGALIRDIGTRFNVKTDTTNHNVQVAVIQGEVVLKKAGKDHLTSAALTKNHFGTLNLKNNQIIIEKGAAKNYLSWKTHKLIFNGEPLGKISRQLERLYDVKIRFKSDQLKNVKLTAQLDRNELKTVLKIIAHTLDIHYRMSGSQVVWME